MSSFSSSTYSRQPMSRTNGTYTSVQNHPRPESPPASAYFSGFAGPHDEPTPTADAPAHFAYSTTLRRHSVEAVAPQRHSFGPLRPFVSTVAEVGGWLQGWADGVKGGLTRDNSLENGWGDPSQAHQPQRETPSAKYAHVSVEDTLRDFQTSANDGLSSSIISSLQAVHGYNEFSVQTPEPLLVKFAKTIYESPLILLLFGSAFVSAIMGNIDDAVSITIAILIVLTGVYLAFVVPMVFLTNSFSVGFVQERRSEKSLEALNKLVPHHCHLIRDSRPIHLLANELVPGDIVTFGVGDRIPADVRLITALELEVDESSLTGETRPAQKGTELCSAGTSRPGQTVALAERTCVTHMGTLVRNGEYLSFL